MEDKRIVRYFWRWFAENCSRFRTMQTSSREELLDEIMVHLHEINEDLYFEVSEPDNDICDFVITAEGRSDLFPLVDKVIAAAPTIKGWTFTPLRPPLGFGFSVNYANINLNPNKLWFCPLFAGQNSEHLGLQIGIPQLKAKDKKKALNATYILLDTGLGERQSIEKIKHVEVISLPKKPDQEGFIRLDLLPNYLNWREQGQARKGSKRRKS